LPLIHAAQKQQEGELFDNGQRVADAACPEGLLDFIDLVFEFSGYHDYP